MRHLPIPLIVLSLILLAASNCRGQTYQVRGTTTVCGPLGCRLQYGYGSAVCVGRYNPGQSLLVTAAHVIRGSREIAVGVGGKWQPAELLGTQTANGSDLALLGVSTPLELPCLPLAEQLPEPGTPVTLSGFPLGGNFRRHDAAVESLSRTLWLTRPSISGDSGGPVAAEGQLVGIISGSTDLTGQHGLTCATPVGVLRAWLLEKYGKLPVCGSVPGSKPGPKEPLPAPQPDPGPAPPVPPAPVDLTPILGRLEALEKRPPVPSASPEEVEKLREELSAAKSRIATLEKEPIKLLIKYSDGQEFRQEYPHGSPIVLDFTVPQKPKQE